MRKIDPKMITEYMFDLFEFEVRVKEDVVSDEYTGRFIESFLDVNSLFWGGGYDLERLNGAICTENDKIDINHAIKEFVSFLVRRMKYR